MTNVEWPGKSDDLVKNRELRRSVVLTKSCSPIANQSLVQRTGYCVPETRDPSRRWDAATDATITASVAGARRHNRSGQGSRSD